jgi:hypothetical protein
MLGNHNVTLQQSNASGGRNASMLSDLHDREIVRSSFASPSSSSTGGSINPAFSTQYNRERYYEPVLCNARSEQPKKSRKFSSILSTDLAADDVVDNIFGKNIAAARSKHDTEQKRINGEIESFLKKTKLTAATKKQIKRCSRRAKRTQITSIARSRESPRKS